MWIAGYNMPGYMPDNEPVECEDFDSAKRYIIGMMKQFEDQDSDRIAQLRVERDTHPDGSVVWAAQNLSSAAEFAELEEQATEYCHGAEQVNLQSGEFSGRFGDYVFWVTKDTK